MGGMAAKILNLITPTDCGGQANRISRYSTEILDMLNLIYVIGTHKHTHILPDVDPSNTIAIYLWKLFKKHVCQGDASIVINHYLKSKIISRGFC